MLLEALTRITGTYPGFVGDDAASLFDDPTEEMFSLVVDEHRPGTVAHAILHMFEAIDVVRDQMSIDTWLVVGSMQRELERLENHADDHTTSDRDEATTSVLNALLHGLLSLSGLASESMVRDLGWQFMETGRRIERALHVTMLVGSTLTTERSAPVESLVVESVLVAGESIITSRRRHRTRALTSTTIGLLFDDRRQPSVPALPARSTRREHRACCTPDPADRVERPGSPATRFVPGSTPPTPPILASVDDHGYRLDLDQFVSAVRDDLTAIADTVEADSFTRFRAQHALIGPHHRHVTARVHAGSADVIYEVSHNTKYDYDAPVVASFAELRQLPDDLDGQHCLRRAITSDPAPDHHREHRDYFGNLTATVVIRDPHTQLVVASSCVVDTAGRPSDFGGRRPPTMARVHRAGGRVGRSPGRGVLTRLGIGRRDRRSSLPTRARHSATRCRSPMGRWRSVAGSTRTSPSMPTRPRSTHRSKPCLELRRGVCQDFAHVMIGALRSLGLAACYVSGYLETMPPPGRPRLIGVDRSHAWVGVYVGGGRWIGVDPTNDQIAGERYITAARGRDYSDVPPLRG